MIPATVAIPARNAESFIARALESVLKQSFKDFEALIVNDGSQDATRRVVERYGDRRVTLINHDGDQGVLAARKTCVENARGEYVFWLDADDYIVPDALDRLLPLAEKEAADMVFFGRTVDEKDGSARRVYTRITDKRRAAICVIKRLCATLPMAKTDILRRVFSKPPPMPAVRFAEDVIITARALACAQKTASSPYFLYHYTYTPTSICHSPRNAAKNAEDLITALDWASAFLTERGRSDWAKTAEEEKAAALKYRRQIQRRWI
jgi:glycosyltransferase involved in cell wall biosynthesis